MGRSTPLRCILLAADALAENDTKLLNGISFHLDYEAELSFYIDNFLR